MHSNQQQGHKPPPPPPPFNMEPQNPSSIFSLYNNNPQMILRQPRPDMPPMMMFYEQEQQIEWRPPPPPPPLQFSNACFKLGLSDESNICGYGSNDVQNPIVHHQYCNSSTKEPFWETNMHTLENSKFIQEDLMTSKGPQPQFSELDSMYNPTRRSSSENNSPAANARPPESLEAEKRSKKKRKMKKKMNNKGFEEELTSMAMFFEGLLKQVMDHQDFIHKKYIEVIERMDRERVEREDEWRRKAAEKDKIEAEERENERSSALRRDALITTYIQNIAGKYENFPTRR